VTRALAPRPRLRLTDAGEAIVQAWALAAEPIVAAAAASLVGEIRGGLALEPRA
jgi:hypothetical protein